MIIFLYVIIYEIKKNAIRHLLLVPLPKEQDLSNNLFKFNSINYKDIDKSFLVKKQVQFRVRQYAKSNIKRYKEPLTNVVIQFFYHRNIF